MLLSAFMLVNAATQVGRLLEPYRGQQVQVVFDRLGYPDRKEQSGTDTVYYWGQDQPTGPSCTIKVAAGDTGAVKSVDVYGNWGCSSYKRSLKR